MNLVTHGHKLDIAHPSPSFDVDTCYGNPSTWLSDGGRLSELWPRAVGCEDGLNEFPL